MVSRLALLHEAPPSVSFRWGFLVHSSSRNQGHPVTRLRAKEGCDHSQTFDSFTIYSPRQVLKTSNPKTPQKKETLKGSNHSLENFSG